MSVEKAESMDNVKTSQTRPQSSPTQKPPPPGKHQTPGVLDHHTLPISGSALVSLALGATSNIVSLFIFFFPIAFLHAFISLLLGVLAFFRTKNKEYKRGKEFAIAGIILSFTALVTAAIMLMLVE